LRRLPDIKIQGLGERIVVNLDVPQDRDHLWRARHRAREDPDFFTAYVGQTTSMPAAR